jgi:hypothetical protein
MRTSSIVNLTVKRRYLTEREVERLMDCACKYGRYGHRDATMILVAFRHGLRASDGSPRYNAARLFDIRHLCLSLRAPQHTALIYK